MKEPFLSDKQSVYITRREPNFDRACDEAYARALMLFRIDENGHPEDKRFERSNSCIKVKFTGYEMSGSMTGQEIAYTFSAWMEKYEDEDEDEDEDESER